ncbi:MAG: endolytic transglycosylase MltG [Clostridia bacterium]|nr:endolytic transglycosylase MltG [Clostridia bacterium]
MNNNNNKLSPMDEIKRITQEATSRKPANGSVSDPAAVPVAPKPAAAPVAPKPAATPTAPKPAAAPVAPKPSAVPVAPKPAVTPTAPKPAAAPVAPKPAATPVAPNPTVNPATPKPVVNPAASRPAVNPATPKPTVNPVASRPATTPVTPKPVTNPTPKPTAESVSRADKVRMARESAMKAREDAQKTRVLDTAEMSAEQLAYLEKQKEEARRLVQNNQSKRNRYATRESKVVKPRPEPKKKTASKNKRADAPKGFEETVGGGVLSNAVKAVIYIVSVLVISGCLSLAIIFVGNDCFAFVKTDVDVVVSIPAGATLDDIAKELKAKDVIEYPNMFKLYIDFLKKKDSGNYVAGSHTVNPTMSYDMLIAQFKPSSGREEITLTIVEGSTTQEIIDLFVENGIGTQEGFEDTIQNYEFDFWFLEELDKIDTSNRIYRLDGYLFPDTYNFFTNCSEADALYKLLSNFEAKFDIENKARVEELGMSVDDIVIMASLIQKEAMYISDYPLVSSVFHNRLDINMKLESNATVQYTMPKEDVKLELTNNQILTYDNGYNTYLYGGLPEGPICNASLNALNWALYPNDTDYLYFVSDMDGYNHYAKTWAEHDRNVQKYQGD